MERTSRLAHELVRRNRVAGLSFLCIKHMRLTPIYSRIRANAYDPFRERVERAGYGRQFPFASWFPEGGRVYLPFEMTSETQGEDGVDKDIQEILEEAGYKIADYRQGLAVNAQGRQYRIGKILQSLYQRESKELDAERENFSEIKFQTRRKRLEEYWTEALALFQNSVYRAHAGSGKPGFLVVISSNIHDIGAMSTGRDWTSCMNLSGGAHSEDVYCEIKKGGFVAYLIKENDKEIRKPLARIAIRRFENKKSGQSLAIPEETVYGNEIEGFSQVVQNWLDSKQGHITPGVFYRRGGEHSDSLEKVMIKGDYTGPQLLKMLRFGLADRWKRRVYVHAAMEGIVSQSKRFSSALLKKFADLLFDPVNQIDVLDLSRFLMRYPEYATQEAYDKLPEYAKDRFDKIDPRFMEGRVKKAYGLLEGGLDIDNPALGLSAERYGQPISYGELGKVQDLLAQFNVIKQLPERLIRQLVKFGRDVLARFGIDGVARNILSGVIHQLSMGDADTPTVVRFYQELLPYFDQLGLDGFGHALAKLGINGTPFLPFLRELLQRKIEEKKGWNPEHEIEQVRYIIDSIENGSGRSDKYQFFR
jgi:hypothetical protein